MINFFTSEITPRVEFITGLVFNKLLNTPYQIFTKPEDFNQQEGIKINYSQNTKIEGEYLKPASLLFDNSILEIIPEVASWKETAILFPSQSSLIPFDLFAASFYLVTRYEEYLPSKKDRYGRFRAQSSIAYKNKFLNQPIVNIWAILFAKELQKKYPEFEWRKPEYKYQATIDIDNAYAFKHKGLIRNLGAALRDIKSKNWHAISTRIKVLLRLENDPYDSYRFIKKLMQSHSLVPKFFVLLNNKGKRDRSLNPKRSSYRKLIRHLQTIGEVGIHPSYQSNQEEVLVEKEIKTLNSILKKSVTASRQHYLKFSLPDTYRKLDQLNIKHEYSMGYAQLPGFRAGISIEYKFFDLLLNKQSNLTIHPFQLMDGTLKNYMNINQEEALEQVKSIIAETKKTGGTFTTIWHNESLTNRGQWRNWKNFYIEMTKLATK